MTRMLNAIALPDSTPPEPMSSHQGNIEAIQYLAQQKPTEEICGAIIDGKLQPCANTADDKGQQFRLTSYCQRLVASALRDGKSVTIYHSHPEGQSQDFSTTDIRGLDELGAKGLLIVLPHCNVKEYDPAAIAPYEGRPWITSHQNCYTLVRDWYTQEFDISLGRYYLEAEGDNFDTGWDDFEKHFQTEGFVDITDGSQQFGDVLAFRMPGAQNVSHVAIRLHPESNQILHSLGFGSSTKEPLRKALQRCLVAVWRHNLRIENAG